MLRRGAEGGIRNRPSAWPAGAPPGAGRPGTISRPRKTPHCGISLNAASNPISLKCQRKKRRFSLFSLWRRGWDSNPRVVSHKLISSQSRYPDFEGKRRKLTDNARVCKPLKNQHFSALEGRKSRKPRQSKEFERNPVLGRKKPVGEKMGRTRGEITVQCR